MRAARRGADIAERLLGLAATIVRLTRKLPRDVGGRHVGSQLVRSATSAGANYEEARAAESRADFIHKVRVAAKEMRETIFWLSLVYCAGHLCLALFESSRPGFYTGLCLIALGSGGIKPCVAAFVGDQFDQTNKHRAKVVFDAF